MGLGLYTGWRTRRVAGAAIVAAVAAAVGCTIALLTAAAITTMVSLHVLASVAASEGLREGFDVPLVPTAIIGALIAVGGAVIGKATSRLAQRPSSSPA
ncbi:MAG: hypothetical protein ACRD1V_17690 [Vicinamibacterales bacterium]